MDQVKFVEDNLWKIWRGMVLSLEDAFLEKPQGDVSNWPPQSF